MSRRVLTYSTVLLTAHKMKEKVGQKVSSTPVVGRGTGKKTKKVGSCFFFFIDILPVRCKSFVHEKYEYWQHLVYLAVCLNTHSVAKTGPFA